jgi:hypothetical protein
MQDSAFGMVLRPRAGASDTRRRREEGRRTDAPLRWISGSGANGCRTGSACDGRRRQVPRREECERCRGRCVRRVRRARDPLRRAVDARGSPRAGCASPGRTRSKCGDSPGCRGGSRIPGRPGAPGPPRARGPPGGGVGAETRVGAVYATRGVGGRACGRRDRAGGSRGAPGTGGIHRELGGPEPTDRAAPAAPTPETIPVKPARSRRRARS